MAAIGLGISMSVIDGSVANTALPSIARELQASPAEAVWIVNGYQLAIVIALLPLAALGDRLGYARVYRFGLAVFLAGSLGCALSRSLPILVAARSLQGLGAAGLMSVNGALVRYTYPKASLGRGVGLNALVVSIASVAGPSVASGILAIAPWPWLFAVNLPIGALNLALAARALPESDRTHHKFDVVSAGLNAIAFGLFFLGFDTLGRTHGLAGLLAVAEVLIAIATGVVLVRREWPRAAPLIPLDLLRIRIFSLSVAASICAFASAMTVFIALPFYFQGVLGRSQVQTGLLLTPWPLGVGLLAPIAGRLSDRIPAGPLGAVGMAMVAVSVGLLSRLGAHASNLDIVWRIALGGLGFGMFQAPNNRTLLSSAPRERAGAAGGMLATARLTGMITGASVAGLAFRLAPGRAETITLAVGAGLAGLSACASLSRGRARPR